MIPVSDTLQLGLRRGCGGDFPCGIPWLGFVVYPTHRLLKRRNAVNFTRRLERNIDAYRAGRITFGELDASVRGWINHVRYADSWGLREHICASHPIRTAGG